MLCIPIVAEDTHEAVSKMSYAKDLTDIFEIRLDLMKTFDILSLVSSAPNPVLVTYRSKAEGGKGHTDHTAAAEYLMEAIQAGADYVDVELGMPAQLQQKIIASKADSQIVISTHVQDHTPSNVGLQSILRNSLSTQSDIIKIVTWANEWEDNLRVLELMSHAKDKEIKIIAFCMGPKGRISRVFSHLMGSYMTFTALDIDEESASGQIPIHEMKKILDLLGI